MSYLPTGYSTGPPPSAPYTHPQPQPPQPQPPATLLEPIARPRRRAYDQTTGRFATDANGAPIIEPAKGRIGTPITVKSNTYWARLKAGARSYYKHTVTILPLARPASTSGLPPPLPSKALLRKVWATLEALEEDPSAFGFFNGELPVFDGRNTCYSAAPLPQSMSTIVTLPGQGERKFSVSITNPIEIPLDELSKWITASPHASQAQVNEALGALNTVVHHGLSMLYPASSSRVTFIDDPENARHNIKQQHQLPLRRSTRHPVGQGIELLRGFFQAVRTCELGLLLQVDVTSGAFVQAGNVKEIVMAFVPTNDSNKIHANRLDSTTRIQINRLLKGTTVQEYFQVFHGTRLDHPDFPCLEVKPGVAYPLEFCSIEAGQRSNRRLTSTQQVMATSFQAVPPSERFSTINAFRQNTMVSCTLPRLRPFQLEINNLNPSLQARVLAPPTISYQGPRHSEPSHGVWKMARRQDRFFSGATCLSFGVIVCSERWAQPTAAFLQSFWRECSEIGMDVPRRSITASSIAVWDGHVGFGHSRLDEADQQIQRAAELGERCFGAQPALLFYVTDKQSDNIYSSWKAAGARKGVATQTLRTKGLQKANDFQFVINVAMKINGKLGGLNFSFVPGTAGGDKSAGWLDVNAPFVLGADLTHVENKPSIATVIASMDSRSLPLLYQAAISVQRLLEPAPNSPSKRGKKQEIIANMQAMVLELLKSYYRCHGCAPSRNVVMYRDGVSDSEWSAVLSLEVPAVKRAFSQFAKEVPEVASWSPKLTYIICVKRHHIRFFSEKSEGQEGRNANIPAGTVVDDAVVDPRAFDWYGAAHTGILGTTRPTRYVVMSDEQTPRLSPDDVQSMTHSLCHAYQRCTCAVSIPAPCYYADLICERVRAWMPMDLDEQRSVAGTATSSEGDAATRQEDLKHFTDALEHAKLGLAAFEASRGKPPIQWWL